MEPSAALRGGTALYARVSSADQKADLDRQIPRLIEYATKSEHSATKTVKEIGSGLNGRRPKLIGLLRDARVQTVIVEHRGRSARFGSESIEAVFFATGRKLVVVDQTEMKDDLVQNMIDVSTLFCARLYGRRSARNKALKAAEATK